MNTWNLRIDRKMVYRILRMSEADRTDWFSAARTRRAELLQRPSKLRKTREAVVSRTLESKNESATDQSINLGDEISLPEIPLQNLSEAGAVQRDIEEALRSEIERRTKAISGQQEFSEQTLTNLLKAVAASPDKFESLEQIEQDCRDLASGRKPA